MFRFRLDAHSLPVEIGQRLRMARVACICPLCQGMHVGDERHCALDCRLFDDIRVRHSRLFDNSHGAMCLFMWHPHPQELVRLCMLQLEHCWRTLGICWPLGTWESATINPCVNGVTVPKLVIRKCQG